MTDRSVAHTILEQLGGNRFIVMTGARYFIADNAILSFSLPARRGPNRVSIELTPADTYTMTFYRATTTKRAHKLTVTDKFEDVYCDQLTDLFTQATGLATRL